MRKLSYLLTTLRNVEVDIDRKPHIAISLSFKIRFAAEGRWHFKNFKFRTEATQQEIIKEKLCCIYCGGKWMQTNLITVFLYEIRDVFSANVMQKFLELAGDCIYVLFIQSNLPYYIVLFITFHSTEYLLTYQLITKLMRSGLMI